MAERVYLIERKGKMGGVFYYLRWLDSSGKRLERSLGKARKSGGKVSARRAEDERRQKEQELAGGESRDKPKRYTLEQFFQSHREAVKPKVSGGTLREYQLTEKHVGEALGKARRIDRIGPAEVGRLESYLWKLGHQPASVNKTLRMFRAMLNRAVRWGWLARNPLTGWEMPSYDPKQGRIFTRPEVDRLVAKASSAWWKTFIRLAADSGLRKLELLHLRWEDVDLDGQAVTVRDHRPGTFKVGEKSYPVIGWRVKAKASRRTVPIPSGAVSQLQRMKLASGGSAYVFLGLDRLRQLERHLEDGWLPAKFDVRPNLLRDFGVIQKAAKVTPAGTVHDFRKSYGSHMATKVEMPLLQRLIGHADIATTARFYVRPTEDAADRVRRALSA